jgi:hypothetical protein
LSYSTAKIVRVTTADAMSAEQWKRAWELAAPVVVAAGRYLDAQADGTAALIEDAHLQLLGAVTQYVYEANADPDDPGDGPMFR